MFQVGEIYYCLDGHHRISIVRAFGQPEIEATVTVWQVEGTRTGTVTAGQQQLSLAGV